MSIDQIVDSMVGQLKIMLPELKTCELVGGKITLEEMNRRSAALPGGYVTCLGTRDGKTEANKFKTTGLFMLALAVQSLPGPNQDRARVISRLTSKALYKIAFAKDWGNDEVESKPQKLASVNPYTTAADGHNVALWGITWEQNLALGDPGEVVLDDFLLASVDYQIVESGPPIDAHDDLEPEQNP